MFQVHADSKNNLLWIEFNKQLTFKDILQCLKRVYNERKNFESAYSSIVKLNENLVFVDEAQPRIDLTIFSGKFHRLKKTVIVYPEHCKTSKRTAEKLQQIYTQCDALSYLAVSEIEAKRLLGILW